MLVYTFAIWKCVPEAFIVMLSLGLLTDISQGSFGLTFDEVAFIP